MSETVKLFYEGQFLVQARGGPIWSPYIKSLPVKCTECGFLTMSCIVCAATQQVVCYQCITFVQPIHGKVVTE